MKKIFTLLLLCATIGFVSCNENEETKVPETVSVTGVKLDKETATINSGESLTLVATVLPENAANKNVRWYTSAPNRFDITQNGKLSTEKDGTVTVFVATEDGNFEAKCVVTVKPQQGRVESITLDKTELTLSIGQTKELIPTLLPETAINKIVQWETSDDEVAEIKGSGSGPGTVTAIGVGECTIKAISKYSPSKTTTCKITVTPAVD